MAEDPLTVHARARVGRMLRGKWTLDRLIGVGGMAAVYEATHRNGSKVAIKMLHPTLMFDTNFAQRLVQEGYVANKINHPSAVRVYDDDTDEVDGAVFLVMELLEGETLSAVRRKRKRIPELEALKMMIPVLEALGSAHSKGIIHRDIKPENLFVIRNGEVRVLDFGIARMTDGSSMTATRTGMVVGSPAYMSPEQALGKMNAVGPQTDVYSIGATLFALISGTTPHAGESTQEMIVMVATQAARSLTKVMPDVNPAVSRIVDKALSYERDNRFADATEMLVDIREAIQEIEGGATARAFPTFAEEDDEGETRVNPQMRQPTPASGVPVGALPPAAGANRVGQRPVEDSPNGLGGKLRAPTLAPMGAPSMGAIQPVPVPLAPPPPPPPPSAAMGPMASTGPMGSLPEGRTPPPGPSPLSPFGSANPLGPIQGISLGAPAVDVGSSSGPRLGATTGMAWTGAPDLDGVPPRRPRTGIFLGVGAVVLLAGLGVAAKVALSDNGNTAVTQPDHTASHPSRVLPSTTASPGAHTPPGSAAPSVPPTEPGGTPAGENPGATAHGNPPSHGAPDSPSGVAPTEPAMLHPMVVVPPVDAPVHGHGHGHGHGSPAPGTPPAAVAAHAAPPPVTPPVSPPATPPVSPPATAHGSSPPASTTPTGHSAMHGTGGHATGTSAPAHAPPPAAPPHATAPPTATSNPTANPAAPGGNAVHGHGHGRHSTTNPLGY